MSEEHIDRGRRLKLSRASGHPHSKDLMFLLNGPYFNFMKNSTAGIVQIYPLPMARSNQL